MWREEKHSRAMKEKIARWVAALWSFLCTERGRVVLVLLGAALFFHWLGGVFADEAARVAERYETRLDAGEWPSVNDYTAVWTHWIARVNFWVCLVAAATVRLWHHPWQAAGEGKDAGGGGTGLRGAPLAFRWCLFLVVILAAVVRLPLAGGGFWHDEALQAKRIHGFYNTNERNEEGLPVFREASWTDTWFHYRSPTNHTVFAVPSRVSLEVWRKAGGREREEFSELAIRMPSLLASLGAVLLVGLAGWRLGWPAAGLLAALWLTLHPWQIRWGVDARAYAIAMFAVMLGVYALIRALQGGRWRWWVVFGLAQMLVLWSSVMQVWYVVLAGLLALGGIWLWRRERPVWPQVSRLGLAGLFAVMCFAQVMGPNLSQLQRANELSPMSERAYRKLDAETLKMTVSEALIGRPYAIPSRPGDRLSPTFEELFGSKGRAGWWLAGAHAVMAAVGMAVWWRRSRLGAVILLAGGMALGVQVMATLAGDYFYYPRFAIFVLPLLSLAMAAGWLGVALVARGRAGPAAALAFGVLGLAMFHASAGPQLANLMREPHIDFRGMERAVAEHTERLGGDVLVAGYGLTSDVFQELYEPRAEFIRSAEELVGKMERSLEEGRPLLLLHGSQAFNRAAVPGGYRWIDDTEFFTPLERFTGNEAGRTFFLLQFTGKRPSL